MPILTVAQSAVGRGPRGVASGLYVPMFISSWLTALGTTANAIGDGGTYDELTADYEDSAEVIAAPGGEGWSASRVLKVYSAAGVRDGYIETRHTTLGEIAEEEVRTFRFGFSSHHKTAAEGATDNSHHGVQDGVPSGAGSNQNWNLTDATNFAGEWEPSVLLINTSAWRYYLDNTVTPTRLSKEVKYTFEMQMQRGSGVNTNAFQFRSWVYNAAGATLFTPANWKAATGSEPMSATRWHTFNNRPGTAAVAFGLNGTGGTWPIYHSNQGEVAVVSSLDNPSLTLGTNIGPYGSCVGEV